MKRWGNASFAMGNDLLMRRTSRLDLKNANAQLHFMNWLTEKKNGMKNRGVQKFHRSQKSKSHAEAMLSFRV